MTTTPLYQIGTFAAGNRLLDPDQRSVQSDQDRTNAITSGHRACRGCGEALAARVVLDAASRAARRTDGHGQRHRLPRGLLDAVPRVGLAAAVAALAVRQRRRGGLRRLRRAARDRSRRHPRRGAGRRRRHRRHRPGLPVGDVRAQRRRALRLLRQPGLHEHRGAAVGCHPAGSQHGDHPTGRDLGRQRVRHRQEPAADRHGPRDPLRRHRDGCRPARPRGQGRRRRCRCTVPATCTCWCPARSAGGRRPPRRSRSPGWRPSAACSRSSRPSTARSPASPRSGSGSPVEDYLRPQTRFAHLFRGEGRPDVVAALQERADRNIARYGLLTEETP